MFFDVRLGNLKHSSSPESVGTRRLFRTLQVEGSPGTIEVDPDTGRMPDEV
jgi:hypothetical protein